MSQGFKQGFIIMGVSGCGKSTLGKLLADKLNCPFIEGDDFHPQANIKKMTAGIALTDADRKPWLQTLAAKAQQLEQTNEYWVLSCSALKPEYREVFRAHKSNIRFVFLNVDKTTLLNRLNNREGHFMPSSLLDSQLNTLSFNNNEEDILEIATQLSTEQQITQILKTINCASTEPDHDQH